MLNNSELDVVNIYFSCAEFGENTFICTQDFERKRNSDVIQGHNSVMNWRKLTFNNPKLDAVHINAYAKFGQNPLLHSQDIQRKPNSDILQGP